MEIAASPAVLFNLLHKEPETASRWDETWNPLLTLYEVIETIDRYTDVVYSVTASQAGGSVCARAPSNWHFTTA